MKVQAINRRKGTVLLSADPLEVREVAALFSSDVAVVEHGAMSPSQGWHIVELLLNHEPVSREEIATLVATSLADPDCVVCNGTGLVKPADRGAHACSTCIPSEVP